MNINFYLPIDLIFFINKCFFLPLPAGKYEAFDNPTTTILS